MWKATCYKSATFAALVVASSLALLPGAQAESLTFGGPGVTFQGVGQPGNGQFSIGIQSSFNNASFDGLSGGTTRFVGPGGGSFANVSVGGFDPATSTFTNIGPNTSTLTGPVQNTLMGLVTMPMFGSNGDLQGNITVTSIQDNTTGLSTGIATLMGDFTTTLSSGALASAFPVGSKATFNLPLQTSDGRFPSVESAFERPLSFGSFPNTTFTPSGLSGPATITPVAAPPEIPLPPALYLFGSVLGGAFWLGRRKRSAVSAEN